MGRGDMGHDEQRKATMFAGGTPLSPLIAATWRPVVMKARLALLISGTGLPPGSEWLPGGRNFDSDGVYACAANRGEIQLPVYFFPYLFPGGISFHSVVCVL